MTVDRKAPGDIRNYHRISLLILGALAVAGAALLWLNSHSGRSLTLTYLGEKVAFGFQLFFWGALGATIAASLFLARDKEDNELESLKPRPDASLLRYPTDIDVHLYGHRILTSACLAVVGSLFLYAGLSYFDVPAELPSPKHRTFFILFAFLIGLYQGNFVTFLNKRFQRILENSADRDPPRG
jgi:hypothetical protein